MRKEESKLWSRIDSNMPRHLYPLLRLERVEPTPINAGIPDLHCLVRGRVSWVELKQVPALPLKPYAKVLANEHQRLSVDQKNWHLSYRKHFGIVATLIGIGSYEYVLVDGRYSDAVNDWSWPLMQQCASIIGKRDTFFPQFYDWLEGKIG